MPLGAIKVSAAGEQPYVAQVGNQKYANYRDAWAAVKNGGEVTMLADWHTAEMLTVEADGCVRVLGTGTYFDAAIRGHAPREQALLYFGFW